MKKSPFLKTYLAILVLGGLAALAYFGPTKDDDDKGKKKEKVLAFDKTKVKELTLSPRDGDAIDLVKEGGVWKMTAPLAVGADSSEADNLVGSLDSLESDEVAAANPAKLGDFGLETPRLTVAVKIEGASEPMKVLFGDKTPDGNSTYAKLPTLARVVTIPAYTATSFEKKPFDLRDRDVLHVKRDAVKTMEVTGPEGDYALTKDDKGEWTVTRPVQSKAGRWAVEGLLGTLESLKMESVAAEQAKDLKPFGLDKPARKVTLGLADGGKKTLEIGSSPREKKYHVRDADKQLVALVPSAIVDDLAKGLGELRAKRLLEVATYEVEGIDVEADAKHVYARSSIKDPKEGFDIYKWKRTVPDNKDVDTNKVQDALFKIGGVEVAQFIDTPGAPASYGFDKPVLKLTLRYAGGKTATWFELGQKDGTTYARRADDQSILKLDTAKADDLIKTFKEL
jgi:hypothetical protein